jgi:hypothetical protein
LITAKIYNEFTGAAITHDEVNEWGLIESLEIDLALENFKSDR